MSADTPSPGQYIGPYRVLRELGSGGMGRVYLARSPGGFDVAVKVLRRGLARDTAYRGRFAAETAAARAVVGAFTAPVVDADPYAATPWLATAYIRGPTLEQLVRASGSMNETRLRELGAGLAEALVAIHLAGVVHRDLKPSNVLMSAGGPRVIDFGISRGVEGFDVAALSAGASGSAGYAAPEQIAPGVEPGFACDVFALGAVLVFAAGGRGPFGEGSPAALVYRTLYEEPDLSAVPESMRESLAACLGKEPGTRPSPAQLLTDLAPNGWRSEPTPPPLPAHSDTEGCREAGTTGVRDISARTTDTGTTVTDGAVTDGAVTDGASATGTTDTDTTDTGTAVTDGASATGPEAQALAGPTDRPPVPGAASPADAPAAGSGLTRRTSLRTAAAAVLFAGTAGAVALVTGRSEGSPVPAASKATSAASEARPLRAVAAPSVISLPRGPQPLWTASPADAPLGGTVQMLGDAVLWSSSSYDVHGAQTVLAFDAADGSQRWNAADAAPDSRFPQPQWYCVSGGLLLGTADSDSSESGGPILVGLGSGGEVALDLIVDVEFLLQVDCAAGGLVLALTTVWENNAYVSGLTAFDMTSGNGKWTIPDPSDTPTNIVADDERWYLYGAGYVYGVALTTGSTQWKAPGYFGDSGYLWPAADALIVSGQLTAANPADSITAGTLALDPATGRRLWSTGAYTPVATVGSTVFSIGTSSQEIAAFEARSGRTLWVYQAPVQPSTAARFGVPDLGNGTWASEQILVIPFDGPSNGSGAAAAKDPGFLVLDSGDGRPLWAHRGSPSPYDAAPAWPVTVSGDVVYAASQTTLYAFKARS